MPITLLRGRKLAGPDPVLVKDQLEALQFMYREWGPSNFTQYMVWILSKKADARNADVVHSRLVPFTFNRAQYDLSCNVSNKNICLKARQMGFTTWFLLHRGLVAGIVEPGTNGFLASQSADKAAEHFGILRRAYKHFGALNPARAEENMLNASLKQHLLHTSYSSRKELIFDQLDNRISIGSAEVEELGQGSSLARVICSEVARWPKNPEETLANLKEAIVLGGTLDLESTGNGAVGYFFEEWQRSSRGESDFKPHFYPWWWDDGYRINLSNPQLIELGNDLKADEQRLREAFHLDLQQIAFRRDKQKSLRHNFAEKYAEDAQSAFLVNGLNFFDVDITKSRLLEVMGEPAYKSYAGGSAKLFARKIPGKMYLIGADPASGKRVGSGLDSSAAKVIDLDSGEEVAAYQSQVSPEDFALDLEQLGRYYNDAIIAVERGTGADSGGEGGTVLLTLVNQKYGNIYKHKEFWKRDMKRQVLVQEGFPMTGRTRPIAINKLRYMLENYPELFHDPILLQQCLLFVRDEKGRPAATENAHDDMVLASAIAQGTRMIVLGYWEPLGERRERYGDTPQDEAAPEELD